MKDYSQNQPESSEAEPIATFAANIIDELRNSVGELFQYNGGSIRISADVVLVKLHPITLHHLPMGARPTLEVKLKSAVDFRLICTSSYFIANIANVLPKDLSVFFNDLPMSDDLVASKLPERPPALWPGARGLKMPLGQALVYFLRAVYLPFINAGLQDEVRLFIRKHDMKLYKAIIEYEKSGAQLPTDIRLLSQRDKIDLIVDKATTKGLESLTPKELLSYARKLKRGQKPDLG